MARNNDNVTPPEPKGNIFVTPIEDVMPQSMLPYAEFVILDRALPRVEDGLKPVQRRILYTMLEMGLTPDKPHKKSARIVGDCMGKYHPHGDSSVYDAMVRMAQDFNMRMTLVNGHGNFGSVDGDPAAAMRYTEARLEPLALELLKDLDKETVPFSFNFDDSLLEPDILPGRYPNLLVNGANGIAVGLATNIPTHNLGEVIDGACAYIDNPKITLEEMMKIIPGPDFSTGANIIKNELVQAYQTGRGKITLRADYRVEITEKGEKAIIINELPYQTNKAELLRKIMIMKEEKKEALADVNEIVDESDRTGMRAVIYCRKDANIDAILEFLCKYTDLECTFGINMVAIAGGKPQQLGLLDMLKYYTQYQRQVVLRRTKFELKEAQARCHILEGLIIGVHNIDEVVRIIKTSESTADARRRLMETFALSERQAQAILDLRLARLAKLEITKLELELKQLRELIERLRKIIDSKTLQMNIVKSEMLEIKKKYKSERRTRIYDSVEQIPYIRKDIRRAACPWRVCITATDNIKFIESDEFDAKIKKPISVKATREYLIKQSVAVSSEAKALIFTNLGNVITLDLSRQESAEFRALGKRLKDICSDVETGEKPVKIFAFDEKLPEGDVMFFTKQGMVKRSPWSEYDLNKTYLPAMKLKPMDEVIAVETFDTDEFSNMLFVTKGGMCLNAFKDDVPTQGRVAGGVKGITLNTGDYVIFACQQNGEGEIIITTPTGAVKRVISSIIAQYARGGKGLIISDRDKCDVLFADYVTMPYAVAIVNEDYSVKEISTEDIPIKDRAVKGKNPDGVSSPKMIVAIKDKKLM